MKKIIHVLGAAVSSAFMYATPIILTLSFVYNWSGLCKLVCFISAFAQFAILVTVVLNITTKNRGG